MKKLLILAILITTLLLAACGPKTSSPEDIAAFCEELEAFRKEMQDIAAMEGTASEQEIQNALGEAGTAYHELQVAGKKLHEPEVDEFFKAATDLSTALKYTGETIPAGTNYLQMMASVNQQADAFQAAYNAVKEDICTMP